jgi:hypothetical protein
LLNVFIFIILLFILLFILVSLFLVIFIVLVVIFITASSADSWHLFTIFVIAVDSVCLSRRLVVFAIIAFAIVATPGLCF